MNAFDEVAQEIANRMSRLPRGVQPAKPEQPRPKTCGSCFHGNTIVGCPRFYYRDKKAAAMKRWSADDPACDKWKEL